MMLLLIAWRNLWRNRARSLLIAVSVALGMWAGAFINALYFGMGIGRMRIAIDQEISHLQIHHPKFADDQEARYNMYADSLRTCLNADPAIKTFSLRTVAPGMLATTAGSQGIQVNGVEPAAENATRQLAGFVRAGQYLDTAARHPVLVSRRTAEKLKLEVGRKIVLTLLDTANTITSGAFRICGLYESLNTPLDELNVFVLKNDLDALIATPGRTHEAAILLYRDEAVDSVRSRLAGELPHYKVQSWQDISPETALILSSLDSYSIIFVVIILLALSFGIVNTMLMAVLERMREIGVLMAIGMSKGRIFAMVVLETVMLAFIGAPLGLFSAWLTVLWLGQTGIDLSSMGETMRDFGFATVIYPVLPWRSVAVTMELVLIAALLAAVFPALKALRLRPVDAIRS